MVIQVMNISKADAIAHLAKWYDAGTPVRASYRTIAGNIVIVGTIRDLSPAAITVAGGGCELRLYFRTTSEYDYQDSRESASVENEMKASKYPTVIGVTFSNGDHLDILECVSAG